MPRPTTPIIRPLEINKGFYPSVRTTITLSAEELGRLVRLIIETGFSPELYPDMTVEERIKNRYFLIERLALGNLEYDTRPAIGPQTIYPDIVGGELYLNTVLFQALMDINETAEADGITREVDKIDS